MFIKDLDHLRGKEGEQIIAEQIETVHLLKIEIKFVFFFTVLWSALSLRNYS